MGESNKGNIEINENVLMNKILLVSYTIVIAVIEAAYLLEVIKGNRTVGYYMIVLILGVSQLLLNIFTYKRNKESNNIKWYVLYGYSALYIFVLLTGTTILTFIYVFPILSALLIFNDYKIIRNFAVIAVTANIVSAGYGLAVLGTNDLVDREIQVLGTVLIMGLATVASYYSKKINDYKIGKIVEQEEKQAELIEKMSEISRHILESMEQISDRAEVLSESADMTAASMEDVSNGSTHTAESVQKQLELNENIQAVTEDIANVTREVKRMSEIADSNVVEGMENVENLNNSAVRVKEHNGIVLNQMTQLEEKMNEALKIISMIDSIAEETNLLALNASIEAARAGEAGKGFAVVAGEITNLANQTKIATDDISNLINVLQNSAKDAFATVEKMTDITEKQNEIIYDMEANFKQIKDSVASISNKVEEQNNEMQNMESSNKNIAENIEIISSISEEVTANSEETLNTARENQNITKEVSTLIVGVTNELKKFEEEYL